MSDVIVIGGGFSGLSAASYLADSGYRVTLLEKHDITGGRARKFEAGGFVFDMGPSWYWMPEVFENFFGDFGRRPEDYYKLKRLDPGYRIYFSGSDSMDIPAGSEELFNLFRDIEPGSEKKLKDFLDDAAVKYDIGINKMVHLPGRSLFEFFRPDLLKGMMKMDALKPLSKSVSKVVNDPRLVQLLEFPVLFLGSTADRTPALYSLMNYADLILGTWYPVGGMYSVVEAMTDLAVSKGVEIICNSEVKALKLDSGRISGVEAADREYPADIVVASADYHHVETKLLPAHARSYSEKYWESRDLAPSAIMFFLGLNTRLEEIEHHNLFFDGDYASHVKDIYEKPGWPEKPAIYVSRTSATDPGVAPEGMENLTILIPVAPGLEETEEILEKYYNYVVDKLEEVSGKSLREKIVFRRSYAQKNFSEDYHALRGNAYGLANTLRQTAILKPKMKSKKVKNLYYTGQLTVPGPGVPPSIISGKVVAGEIKKAFPN